MSRKLIIILIVAISLVVASGVTLAVVLSVPEEKFEIMAAEKLPDVEPYKDFDLTKAIVAEEGVEYSYSALYVSDGGAEQELELSGTTINVPKTSGFVRVTVSAAKKNKTDTKVIDLNIKGVGDAVDEGFNILWGEDTIKKVVNYDPQYIKEGDSSLKVSFAGYYLDYGTQFANFLGRLCTVEGGVYDDEYFSIYKDHKEDQEEAWKDAVVTFWVYYSATPKNHPDAKLDIGYFFKHRDGAEVAPQYMRSYEFGESPLVTCEPGQWTQIAIRLKDLGKVDQLFFNYEKYVRMVFDVGKDCDLISFKCRVSDPDYNSGELKYTYSFYMDGFDIITYDDFTRKNPGFDFGVNWGDTVNGKVEIENWLLERKGISFEYSFVDPENAGSDTFALYFDGAGGEWQRLTDWITLDFISNSATVGRILDLGGGRYRYELMFEDAVLNAAPGETPNGTETLNLIWYSNYGTELNTSNYKEISNYSA